MNPIGRIIFFILLSLSTSVLLAQNGRSDDLDTTLAQDTTDIQYKKASEGTFSKLFRGKPGKAALYGLVIPGGGQVYNRKYFSAVIAAGIDIGILVYLIDRRRYFNFLNDHYLCLLNEGDCNLNITNDVSVIRNARNIARQEVEYGYLYMAGAHFLTVIWAYVQAHLMDFDDSDDLSFNFEIIPTQVGSFTSATPTLGITIPLNKRTKKLSDYRLVQP